MRAHDFARRKAVIEGRAARSQQWKTKAIRHLIRRAQAAVILSWGRIVGYRMPDGSVACVKERFSDAASACAEIERIAQQSTASYVPVRAYRCEYCRGWHTTSRGRA